MALGKRQDEKQQELFVATAHVPKSPGHPFYKRVNELLKEAGFDEWTVARGHVGHGVAAIAGSSKNPVVRCDVLYIHLQ